MQNIESAPLTEVRIAVDDFETRAREMQITEPNQFYASNEFLANGFRLDGKEIVKKVF